MDKENNKALVVYYSETGTTEAIAKKISQANVFEQLNREREAAEEPLFANPRNAASGTLKSKSSSLVANRHLDAYLYYLLGNDIPTDGHYENIMEAAQWGFKVSQGMRKAKNLQEIFSFISHWEIGRASCRERVF